jgi:dipeptidyl aminopeptidase/acylaminoacyl peptidase
LTISFRARRRAAALAIVCAGSLSDACASSRTELPDEVAPGPHTDLIQKLTRPLGAESMVLSPDGRHVAALLEGVDLRSVMLIDAQTLAVREIVGKESPWGEWSARKYGYVMPTSVAWADNDKLIVCLNLGECDTFDLEGRKEYELGDRVYRRIEQDGKPTGKVVVHRRGFGSPYYQVDTRTGEATSIPLGLSGNTGDELFDAKGNLRVVTAIESHWFSQDAKASTWYRKDNASAWQLVQQVGLTEDRWQAVFASADSDTLIVASRQGRDTRAIFHFDAAGRTFADMMAGHPTEDLGGILSEEGGDLLRVQTFGLKPQTVWLDPAWKGLQAAVDQALPDHVNTLSGRIGGNVLVRSWSDVDPGHYFLLDSARMTMRSLASARTAVDAAAMRPMKAITYSSLDGRSIPAYLTLPSATGPQPMVVYVHGGPQLRDYWGWNAEVQLLAAAGYVVFQPQFRGSAGFGAAFEQAGWHQWGLAMQDDVTAGVRYLVDKGIADPKRICIYGASYGGYAALWGLAKTPELYRCGVSLAGVTDIGEMLTDWSDANADEAGRAWHRKMLGDEKTDKASFDAVSPEKHANRIQAPVLIEHGEEDIRVPIGHAKRMTRALEGAGKPVWTRWYAREAHGFRYLADQRIFLADLLGFLDRYIAPTASMAAAPTAPGSAAAAPGPAVAGTGQAGAGVPTH